MRCWTITTVNPAAGSIPMYVGIGDADTDARHRRLVIEDSEGRTVTLNGEEIGELYRAIKPALAG